MLVSASEFAGNTGNGSSAAPVSNPNEGKSWWDRIVEQFVHSKTGMTNDYMRGAYNAKELLGGNPVPVTESLNEAAGNLSGDYQPPSPDEPGGSLDPSGFSQAQWEFERQKELLAEQRAYNSAEAEKAREWQERMSNTAYQRAVEDLNQAGLNKWLAITGGGNGASASTPSGASASSSAGDASAPNPAIYKALMQFITAITKSAISLVDIL